MSLVPRDVAVHELGELMDDEIEQDALKLIEASKVLFKHGALRSSEMLEQWAARIRGEL